VQGKLMNIANNILKNSLKNVYFLAGTPLSGKTTMATALTEKHGFVFFSEDWYTDSFKLFRSLCNEQYQPYSYRKKTIDREVHYSKTIEELLADDSASKGNDEYIEFAIVELIKLSQEKKVITDIVIPIKLVAELSDYNRIACLMTSPELITCENYGKRESHKAFLDMLKSLKEPEKKIAVQDVMFRIRAEEAYEQVRQFNLFNIVRTEESTIEGMLISLEKHFML
jgi:adenylate kinase family enzyme